LKETQVTAQVLVGRVPGVPSEPMPGVQCFPDPEQMELHSWPDCTTAHTGTNKTKVTRVRSVAGRTARTWLSAFT
jgi:hypothetical protein